MLKYHYLDSATQDNLAYSVFSLVSGPSELLIAGPVFRSTDLMELKPKVLMINNIEISMRNTVRIVSTAIDDLVYALCKKEILEE